MQVTAVSPNRSLQSRQRNAYKQGKFHHNVVERIFDRCTTVNCMLWKILQEIYVVNIHDGGEALEHISDNSIRLANSHYE